jgi:hypothetical protein
MSVCKCAAEVMQIEPLLLLCAEEEGEEVQPLVVGRVELQTGVHVLQRALDVVHLGVEECQGEAHRSAAGVCVHGRPEARAGLRQGRVLLHVHARLLCRAQLCEALHVQRARLQVVCEGGMCARRICARSLGIAQVLQGQLRRKQQRAAVVGRLGHIALEVCE